MADVCPRVGCNMPLMRSREGRVVCCSCRADIVSRNRNENNNTEQANGTHENEKNEKNDEDEEVKEKDNDNPTSASVPVVPIIESRAIVPAHSINNHRAVTRDGMSAALGDKLLQGWTLLQDNCNNCGTPLIRNNSGMITCVGCGQHPSSSSSALPPSSTSNENTNTELVLGSSNSPATTTTAATTTPTSTRTTTTTAAGTTTAATTSNVPPDVSVGGNRTRATRVRANGVRAIEGSGTGGIGTGHHQVPGRQRDGVDVNVDVDDELRMAEMAAAYNLQMLRLNLPMATDAETRRVICMAMTEAARTVEAVRKALQARLRVV